MSPQDVTRYLEERSARGVKIIQGPLLYSIPAADIQAAKAHLPNQARARSLDSVHQAILQRLDWIVQEAGRLHLLLFIAPVWGPASDEAFDSPQSLAQFETLIARRYAAQPHVNYIPVGEYHKIRYSRDQSAPARWTQPKRLLRASEINWLRAAVIALRRNMHPNALLAFHGDAGYAIHVDWKDESRIDLYLHQSYASLRDVVHAVDASNASSPHKPFIQAEVHYESTAGSTGQPWQIRNAAYHTLLRGGAGFTYGNQAIWRFAPDWQSHLDDPGGKHIFSHFRNFVDTMYRETNQPAPDLVTHVQDVPGSEDAVSAMRSADNRHVWMYFSHGQSAELNGQRLPGGRLVASWFNPRDGSSRVVRLKPRHRLSINPPGEAGSDNDWLLEIRGTRAD